MKSVRRVELHLMEDVVVAPADFPTERMMVPHNFSPNQAMEIIFKLLTSLDAILTAEEMKDRVEDLEKALGELRSRLGTERAGRGRLAIHEG